MRKNYYKDLRSDLVWRTALKLDSGFSVPRTLQLAGRGLTKFAHQERLFLCSELDLSANPIREVPWTLLPSLERVVLDGTDISNLRGSGALACLRQISARKTRIASKDALKDLPPNLELLNISETPLAGSLDLEELKQSLVQSHPNLKICS